MADDLIKAIGRKTRLQEWGSKSRQTKEHSDEVQFQRALNNMQALVTGKMLLSRKTNKYKKLDGGDTADKVMKLLRAGVSAEAILLHVPLLPYRFDWEPVREDLFALANKKKLDLKQVERLFGFSHPTDDLAPSLEVSEEEITDLPSLKPAPADLPPQELDEMITEWLDKTGKGMSL